MGTLHQEPPGVVVVVVVVLGRSKDSKANVYFAFVWGAADNNSTTDRSVEDMSAFAHLKNKKIHQKLQNVKSGSTAALLTVGVFAHHHHGDTWGTPLFFMEP